jgi:hypothetical protein
MQLLKLPISQSEAWRLYNQNQPVIITKAWSEETLSVPPGQSYEDFTKGKFFAIPLSKEESLPFWQLYKKFAWIVAGAACTGPMGLILGALSFLAAHPAQLAQRYQTYGVISFILLSICFTCIGLMVKQAQSETKLWHQLFDKYQVSDWKKSWR